MRSSNIPIYLAGRPPRFRQLVAVTLLLALVSALLFLIIAPLLKANFEGRQTIENLNALIPRYTVVLSNTNAELKALQQLKAKAEERPYIYKNEDIPIVTTRFEAHVRDTVRASGVELVNLLPGLPQVGETLSKIPLSIELAGTPGQIAELVFTLENAAPLARFDRFEFTVAPSDPETANVKATVIAFLLPQIRPVQ